MEFFEGEFFNNSVVTSWRGLVNDCTIEYSLMACVIGQCTKTFRFHFHFAGK